MSAGELIQSLAVVITVAAHWLDSVRRSSRAEARADTRAESIERRVDDMAIKLDETRDKVVYIEGRLNGKSHP